MEEDELYAVISEVADVGFFLARLARRVNVLVWWSYSKGSATAGCPPPSRRGAEEDRGRRVKYADFERDKNWMYYK